MGKYLFGTAGPAAPYGTASLLEVLPFEQGAPGRYGVIHFRDKNPCVLACRTNIRSRELADELGDWYLPGGINISYIEQGNSDWLVCFRAGSILAAAYMRLTTEEMQKLLEKAGMAV